MNNKIRIPLKGTNITDLIPDVSRMTELLLEKGFRALTKESSQELPVGSLVLIHSAKNQSISFALIQKHIFWKNANKT